MVARFLVFPVKEGKLLYMFWDLLVLFFLVAVIVLVVWSISMSSLKFSGMLA